MSGSDSGRVLAVAVEQHHDVEVVLDRPVVAGLLVAAVAEVARVADDLEGQVGAELLVAEADQVGAVLAGVVADSTLVMRLRKASGMRSRTVASVDAALYATTRMPMRWADVARA